MSERVLEIRTYRLHAGERDAYHRVVLEQARPLLAEFGVDVVRVGPSEQDEDGVQEYVLIRSFASLTERDEQEERFYGSREWHDGPRDGIISRIESYHTIVLTVPVAVVEGLRG
jgi:NIPSNAP